jgi:Heterokaryon incompatibility protein (HET)
MVLFENVDLSQLKYAALSYVWGEKQRITLQRSNYANLQNRGSLVGRMPRTIEDAVYLTGALGVQYLWVDAFCIIQDNNADKEAQIGNMGNVYAHSLFTIIAAAGGDTETGLPEIRAPRRAVQEEVLIHRPGSGLPLSLITMLNPTSDQYRHYTEGTVWASRGWTLQERVPTKRAIIVMKEQVLWACGKSSWAEETYSETSLARASWFALQESE